MVDDGSTDDLSSELREFEDPRVNLHRLPGSGRGEGEERGRLEAMISAAGLTRHVRLDDQHAQARTAARERLSGGNQDVVSLDEAQATHCDGDLGVRLDAQGQPRRVIRRLGTCWGASGHTSTPL